MRVPLLFAALAAAAVSPVQAQRLDHGTHVAGHPVVKMEVRPVPVSPGFPGMSRQSERDRRWNSAVIGALAGAALGGAFGIIADRTSRGEAIGPPSYVLAVPLGAAIGLLAGLYVGGRPGTSTRAGEPLSGPGAPRQPFADAAPRR